MKINRVVSALFIACLTVSALAADLPIRMNVPWTRNEAGTSFSVAPETTLIVSNPGGEIMALPSRTGEVEVSLSAMGSLQPGKTYAIEVVEIRPGVIKVEVVYPPESLSEVPPAIDYSPEDFFETSHWLELKSGVIFQISDDGMQPHERPRGASLGIHIPADLVRNISLCSRTSKVTACDLNFELGSDKVDKRRGVLHASPGTGQEVKIARVRHAELLLPSTRLRILNCSALLKTAGYEDRVREIF